MAYSKEVREAVLDKLFHSGLSSHQVAEETGVPRATIYGWKKRYMVKKEKSAVVNAQAENWSAEEKFAAVLHTATLSEVELNAYCRENGVYPGQIKSWREACIEGVKPPGKQQHRNSSQKEDKRKIQSLERELQRKEKALADRVKVTVWLSSATRWMR